MEMAVHYERKNPTMSPKAISNYTKFFGGWCNYFDWCPQFTLVRISIKNLKREIERI